MPKTSDVRYCIVTRIDETGEVRDLVASGFTEKERRGFLDRPDGL